MSRYGPWIFIIVLLAAFNALAVVYVWTDADGVRHYTNTPPPADAVITKTYEEVPSTPIPRTQEPEDAAPEPTPVPESSAGVTTTDDRGGNQRVPVGDLAIGKAKAREAAELIEKERRHLAERLQMLNGELERIQVEQLRKPDADQAPLAERFAQIQAEIRQEIEQSERRIEEIKKKYGTE